MTNYLLLIIVIVISFLSVSPYDFYPEEQSVGLLDTVRLLVPGFSFSFFIVFVQRLQRSLAKLVLLFIALIILFTLSLITGIYSWGITVPIAGGIGPLIIRKLFFPELKLFDARGKKYLAVGSVSSLVGLAVFYTFIGNWPAGVGFSFILSLWQLAFGVLWIKEKEAIPLSATN